MDAFISAVKNIFDPIISVLLSFSWKDALDILIMAYLIYKAISLVRQTRAEQLLKGICIFVLSYWVSLWLELNVLSYVLGIVLNFGVIAIIILFQPELRRALEQVGGSGFKFSTFSSKKDESEIVWQPAITAICRAASEFQMDKTGALIVIERKTRLGEIANTGTVIDAVASEDLFKNIFFPKTALHDGAVIIRDGKVHAAGCILPLTQKSEIFRNLGTRHRAAVGVSEHSDALVVVVSEETGTISIADNGRLIRDLSPSALRLSLEEELITMNKENEQIKKNKLVSKIFGRKEQNNEEE